LLLGTVLFFAQSKKPQPKPKKQEAMQIDLQTLPKLTPPKPKTLQPLEAYDEKPNKEKGDAPKEIKDAKPAPKKIKEPNPQSTEKPVQNTPSKPKAPLVQEKEKSPFPSFDEIGKAVSKQIQSEQEKIQTERQNRELRELYGKDYESLGKAQKKFLTTNLKTIQTITQRELNTMGYPQIAVRTRANGANLVEFYLYPNGDISDLRLIEYSGVSSLDGHTIELIQRAYKDYPYPEQKTLVRIKVIYSAF
jgi:protein TonB